MNRASGFLARHGSKLAIAVCLVVGVHLIVRGLTSAPDRVRRRRTSRASSRKAATAGGWRRSRRHASVMSRDSRGSASATTATSAPGPVASERGRIATPIPRATSRRIRLLSFDSSLILGSNPACLPAVSRSSRRRAPARKLMNSSPASCAIASRRRRACRWSVGSTATSSSDTSWWSSRPSLSICSVTDRNARSSSSCRSIAASSSLDCSRTVSSTAGMALVEDRQHQRDVDRAHRVHRADRHASALDALASIRAPRVGRAVSARIRRARATSSSPASVILTWRVLRSTSVRPSSSSSRLICWDSAGCATCTRSAARVKCCSSASATRYES